MKTNRAKWAVLALFLSLASCVGGGYDLQRYQNDSKHQELMAGVVTRFLAGDPPTADERVELPAAVAEWEARLVADARVLGVTR